MFFYHTGSSTASESNVFLKPDNPKSAVSSAGPFPRGGGAAPSYEGRVGGRGGPHDRGADHRGGRRGGGDHGSTFRRGYRHDQRDDMHNARREQRRDIANKGNKESWGTSPEQFKQE